MTDPQMQPAAQGWMARLAPFAAAFTGLVLAFSALTKFLSPKAFVAAIGEYGLFPESLILPVATGVTALEFALGLMLISGIGRRSATRIALPLVVAFTLLILRAISTGMTGCGCFGEVVSVPPRVELVLDLVLLAALVVVWRAGEDLHIARGRFASSFGWVAFSIGAVIFLARGPVVAGTGELDVDRDDLAVLAQADPPLPLPREGFLFFFSADCDHCWAYAGGVELMAQRVEGLEVAGVTLSGPAELDAFREAFRPSYPIHTLEPRQFNALAPDYPAAIWIQGGEIAGTWAGYVPGLRKIAEEGGYFYEVVEEPVRALGGDGDAAERFGGPLRGRQ
jgi:hypothetical protein